MLKSKDEISKYIADGRVLLLAGEEEALSGLPKGNWIGGTIPYFMDETGGLVSRDRIFATELPPDVIRTTIKEYDEKSIGSIASDAFENGFTFLVIPSGSKVHVKYAQDAPNFDGIFLHPVVGWISGIHLSDMGGKTPKVFNGKDLKRSDSSAIAIHCELTPKKSCRIGMVNLFEQGTGDALGFDEEGFTVRNCLVNGRKTSFSAYLREKGIDTKLPLVADYCGTMVNVSIQEVRADEVALYAPVFKGVEYRIAKPVQDYVNQFKAALPKGISPVFSCNCILNFLYSNLEGKKTERMYGPVTFGEIAYQLLNQTLVYLVIE